MIDKKLLESFFADADQIKVYRRKYHEYLQSPEWQKKRLQRLRIDDFRCVRCGSAMNLHIHHINYGKDYRNADVLNDLVTLCERCHRAIHELR